MYIISYDLSGMTLAIMFALVHLLIFDKKERVNRMFQTYMLLAAFECAMNVFTGKIIDGYIHVSDFWGFLFNQIYFGAAMFTAYYGYRMVAAKLKYSGRFLTYLANSILIFGEACIFINFFKRFLYTFENGQYIKTPLFNAFYVISFSFAILIVFVAISKFKECEKAEKMAPVVFIFMLVGTFVVQVIFPNVLLTGLGKTLAGIAYCMYLEKPEHIMLRNVVLELESLQREQMIMDKQLEEANEAKTKFIVSMSHKLRTPINAIMGYDEIIIRECSDAKLHEDAMELSRCGNKLLNIVEEIVDFSQIEAGSIELHKCEYEIGEAFIYIHECLTNLRRRRNIKITNDLSPDIPQRLYGDKKRVYQVIAKLIEMSVLDNYESELTIRLVVDKIEDNLVFLRCFIINKNITALEQIPAIEDDVEYTLLKSILNIMNSELTYSFDKENGIIYSFNIIQEIVDLKPVGDVFEAAERFKKNMGREESPYRFTLPSARILVVDDTSTNLSVFAGLTEPFKLKLTKATSGLEALDIMRKEEFDLVFMDILMPEMDGIETLNHIRNDNSILSNDVAVIALTANVFLGAKDKYLEDGFAEYIAKPVSALKLAEAFKRFIPEKIDTDWVSFKSYEKDNDKDRLSAFSYDNEDRYSGFLDDNEDSYTGFLDNNEEENEASNDTNKSDHFDAFDYIEGLDVQSGLTACMGNMDLYMDILKDFCMNDTANKLNNFYDSKDWDNFRILIHGTKSAANTAGLNYLSQEARKLEDAARDLELDYIYTNFSDFITKYISVTEMMKELF